MSPGWHLGWAAFNSSVTSIWQPVVWVTSAFNHRRRKLRACCVPLPQGPRRWMRPALFSKALPEAAWNARPADLRRRLVCNPASVHRFTFEGASKKHCPVTPPSYSPSSPSSPLSCPVSFQALLLSELLFSSVYVFGYCLSPTLEYKPQEGRDQFLQVPG